MKLIKQVELATKWRPLVPLVFRDDICPIPPQEVLDKFKKDRKEKGKETRTLKDKESNEGTFDELSKLKLTEIKERLKQLGLSRTGNKSMLLDRLHDALKKNNDQLELV